jgi:uncharacterized membrane protein
MEDPAARADEGRSVGRLVAFSDGVFAIAMTLLVLNLSVPDVHGPDQGAKLWAAFRDQAPEFFSYILSFAVIGRYWVVHHRMFRVVVRADPRLLVLNLVLLGCIAVIPYPTEALGRYGDTTTAVVLYSAVLTLTGIANAAISWHVDHADLLDPRVTVAYRRHSWVRAVTLPIVFGLAIPIAFVDPTLAMISWGISASVLTVLGKRRYGSIGDPFSA